ncbi:MAG: Spi family protease inhibitor, partial [Bacteroidales bacterium]|nr:Spi family protease inhibitor [Bacteroidales bacterium]
MKKYPLLLSLIIFVYLFIPFTVYAGSIEYPIARLVALNKIKSLNHDHTYRLANSEKIVYSEQGSILCYIFKLNPVGFIVVSGETDLPPIIAYSFKNNCYSEELENNPLIELLRTDIINRLQNLDKIPKSILQQRNNEWELLLTNN